MSRTIALTIEETSALHKMPVEEPLSLSRPVGLQHPLVFDSPHSGTPYPADFRFSCEKAALEKLISLCTHYVRENTPQKPLQIHPEEHDPRY